MSVHNDNPEKIALSNYNIFIRRRDELDEFKVVYITVDLLFLLDKKPINIETKNLDFTIFINKIYRHKYTHFDGARDRLK